MPDPHDRTANPEALSTRQELARRCRAVTEARWFALAVFTLILANAALLGAPVADHRHQVGAGQPCARYARFCDEPVHRHALRIVGPAVLGRQLRLVADQEKDLGLDSLAQPFIPSGRVVGAGIVHSINGNRKPCLSGAGGLAGMDRPRVTPLPGW